MALPIIVITGPDGSGKTTACKGAALKLAQQFGKNSVACVSIWDSLTGADLFKKEAIMRYLSTLAGPARTLFLFHAMRHSLDLALARAPKLLLVDSYFYKYAATELAHGTPENIVRGAMLGFEKPALTLHLDVEPEVAFKRKPETSHYESDGGNFVRFQKSTLVHWKQLEADYGPWIHIAACGTAEAAVTKVVAVIDRSDVCKQLSN